MTSQSRSPIDNGTGNPPLSLEKEAAPFDIEESEFVLRKDVAKSIIRLFGIANTVVLVVILVLIGIDTWMVNTGLVKSTERIIDSKVVMSLVGATTVQMGAILVTIASYLFPKNGRNKS
jgi:hypothetical protein